MPVSLVPPLCKEKLSHTNEQNRLCPNTPHPLQKQTNNNPKQKSKQKQTSKKEQIRREKKERNKNAQEMQ